MSCWCDDLKGYNCVDCEEKEEWRKKTTSEKSSVIELSLFLEETGEITEKSILEYKQILDKQDKHGVSICDIPASMC